MAQLTQASLTQRSCCTNFNVEYDEPSLWGSAREAYLAEEDRLAHRLYEAAGFRRTEGEGGPPMLAYEREL